jgi:hypothetical protein
MENLMKTLKYPALMAIVLAILFASCGTADKKSTPADYFPKIIPAKFSCQIDNPGCQCLLV